MKVKLTLEGIAKKLGDFSLKEISLEVKPGEYFVILGPSGAGKTVLLEILAGIYPPDQGKIWLGERDITHWPPEKRRFGFVYQDHALFPHPTVEGNIGFGLRDSRLNPLQRKQEIRETADLLGIAHLLSRQPHTLSGGESQRVALARALITRPPVLLLDEPLSSLDPPTREILQQELKRLHLIFGSIFIHVTHDFEEAFFLGERIGVLMGGN